MKQQKPEENGVESPEELPYKLYSAREVAIEMDVPPRFISAIRKFGAPFLLGQSHPAWVFDWVKEHAGDKAFQGPLQPRDRKS